MMQPCASTARFRGGGAHSLRRRESHACLGSPPPRIVFSTRRLLATGAELLGKALMLTGRSRRGTEHDAVWQLTSGELTARCAACGPAQ